MLAITRYMEANYYRDQFGLFIIYGQQGIGKSVYSIMAMQELGIDWKTHMFFRADEFLERVKKAYYNREKIKALCLDDAGVAVFAYNWHNRWVKAFVQFINIARPTVANIILTTPNPSMLVKKLTTLDCFYVKVVKDVSDTQHGQEWRVAKGYKNILLPSGRKLVKQVFEDKFKAKLPKEIFEDYTEYRYTYVYDVIQEMIEALPSLYTAQEQQ